MTTWEIIPPGRQSTSSWAGGKTTELYIHPRSARYADRDFDFRISSATVETEESEFTALPGFTRHLLPLRGELRLVHEGQAARTLRPYAVDTFDGGWHTVSHGLCTDLGLMLRRGWTGELRPLPLMGSAICAPGAFSGVYAQEPTRLLVTGPGRQPETIDLEAGALLMLRHDETDAPVELSAEAHGAAAPLIYVTCRPAAQNLS